MKYAVSKVIIKICNVYFISDDQEASEKSSPEEKKCDGEDSDSDDLEASLKVDVQNFSIIAIMLIIANDLTEVHCTLSHLFNFRKKL